MNLKLVPTVLTFFLFTIIISAQSPMQIEKTASDVILAVAENKSLPAAETNSIYQDYYSNTDTSEFEKNYSTTATAYDSLREYIAELKNKFNSISNDSAVVLLNGYYLQISNTFYNYFKNEFFSSTKPKIIFFSASVSCACTLEMCRKQLIDMLKFKKENKEKYDCWVVDSYMNNELQIKYETFFAPSVLVFSPDNKVIHKIEYDEQMINNLTNFLAANNEKGE